MAYINSEHVKQIRESLKKEFPETKFSVRKNDNISICVSILKSPYDFSDLPHYRSDSHTSVNHFRVPDCKHRRILEKVLEIIRTGSDRKWFDKSDSMTDYFYTAFYIHLYVGHWEKGYEVIDFPKPKKKKKTTKRVNKNNQAKKITEDFISSL